MLPKIVDKIRVDGIVPLVLGAFDATQSSRDSAYKILQESNFLWLTGIREPGWILAIDEAKTYLIMPERSETQHLFEGGLSADVAKELSGADEVISASKGQELLARLAKKYPGVFTLGVDPVASSSEFALNPAPGRLRRQLKKAFGVVRDCRPQLSALRALKQSHEIAHIQKAINVTCDAFGRIYEVLGQAQASHEYELEAHMTYVIRSAGAEGHAYDPIVAGGKNALTLHYNENNDVLPKRGLVLLDVGARLNGYAADITRTYAIGTPTEREKAVHAAVEKAHFAIIDLIKPGVALKDYQDQSDVIMKDALRGLGLLNKSSDYRKYFPHAVSHGLGLDVHESLGGYKEFMPGMVLTVEPGIYIPEEGIGVRIEDDILVTETGHRNLSAALPTHL
jgi:Xaa-Pro aminopeptidase